MGKLEGKKAVVTGGSRGIGRAICIALAKEGADVLVNFAGNQEAAEETVHLCKAFGVDALAVQADVSKAEACEALAKAAIEHLSSVDILVNNAGISCDKLLFQVSEEELEATLDTNLKSVFFCSKYFLKLMRKQKSGRIINMSSVVGLHGNAGQSMYAASKAGIIGVTKSLAKEFASRGITINAVAPGFIETDMTDALPETVKEAILEQIPLKRMGSAEEVASLVTYLAEDSAAYITGQVFSVDGGMGI